MDNKRSTSPRRFPSFWHLLSLATTLLLVAASTIPFTSISFVFLSFPYLYLLSSLAFPNNSPNPSPSPSPPIFPNNRLLGAYVLFSGVLGLLLPIAYLLDRFLAGDAASVAAAAPHLFLLAAQVFLEGFAFSRGFAVPVFAFVPILYNSRRMFALADWVRYEIGKGDDSGGRKLAGRVLAVGNLVLWAYNLFGFLIPVYLPRALKRYYCGFSAGNENKDTDKNNSDDKKAS
ncbi:uncharacterized protein [Typha latifolia]|uniref:uncharacterized protein n=1 Tax=Typha latifolia TaxID=4733 RepID=UPI003C2D97B0